MTIDTLAYTKHLVEKGHFNQQQAEALVEAQRDHVIPDLATRDEMLKLHKELLHRFDQLQQRVDTRHHELDAKLSRNILIATGIIIAAIGLFTKVL